MSRTDKTRPWWVRKIENKIERPRLGHDDTYLGYYTYKWWLGEMRCGCPMCTDQDGRKAKARKDRHDGKKAARSWEKDY